MFCQFLGVWYAREEIREARVLAKIRYEASVWHYKFRVEWHYAFIHAYEKIFEKFYVEEELWKMLVSLKKEACKDLSNRALGYGTRWLKVEEQMNTICREIGSFLFDELAAELAYYWEFLSKLVEEKNVVFLSTILEWKY